MKTRLRVPNVSDIICKKIRTIVIDGTTYHKDNYITSIEIQNFYRLITKNIEKITYIKYGTFVNGEFKEGYYEMYLRNSKLHNCGGLSRTFNGDSLGHYQNLYYIDGERFYTKTDWLKHPKRKIWLRENKLKRILSE